MNDQETISSIKIIRETVQDFIDEKIALEEFLNKLSFELGCNFDPIDYALMDLPNDLKIEVILYLKLTGGEFGENKHLIPKNKNWKYGEATNKNYDWIDEKEYRKLIKSEVDKIKIMEI